jgi:hypothetical protein
MNTNWILYLVIPLCASPLFAPVQQASAPRKLARIPQQDQRRDEPARAPDVTLEDWKQKLSDTDLDRREEAFSELVQRAREDRELRQSIEKWSKSNAAPELAWSARMALRELRGGPRGRAGADAGDLRRRMEELEQHFGGMDSTFEDLRTRMDSMLRAVPPSQWQPAPGSSQQAQGYTLRMGPDGVTVETTENVDGNSQKKTYKAKDMDELLQNYPELRDRIGGGEGFTFYGTPGQNGVLVRPGQPGNDWFRNSRPSQQPPTDVLGIYSQKLTPEQAKDMELQPEQGLRVERVEPGTIAQILGIRRGDTIVELDGQPIYSTDDVRKILKERKPDEDLTVKLIAEGSKEARTLRWSPAPPPGNGPLPDKAPPDKAPQPGSPSQPRKF